MDPEKAGAAELSSEYIKVFLLMLLTTAATYGMRVIISRLGSEAYGEFYAFMSLAGIVGMLSNPGISTAMVNAIASGRDRPKVFWTGLSMMLLLSIAVSAAAALSAGFASSITNISAPLIMTLALVLPSSAVYSAAISAIQGMNLPALSNMLSFVRVLLALALSWIAVQHGLGIQWVSIGYAIAALLPSMLAIPVFIPGLSMPDTAEAKKLLSYGLPVFVSAASLSLFNNLDTVMISSFRGAVEASYYEIAMPFSTALKYVIYPLTAVLFPFISALWKSDRRKASEAASMSLKLAMLLVVPAAVVFSYPDILIRLVFGIQYLPAAPAVRILAASAVFWSLYSVLAVFVSAAGRPELATRASLVAGGLNVLADFFAIPLFGFVGSAVTTLLGGALAFLIILASARKWIKIGLPDIVKAGIIGTAGALSIYAARLLPFGMAVKLVASAIFFSLSVVATMKLLGYMSQNEKKHLSSVPLWRLVAWIF